MLAETNELRDGNKRPHENFYYRKNSKWAIRSQALRVVMVRPMGAVQRLNVGGLEKSNQLR